ncbi:hypothetical protein [Brevibacillus parabrevis]|uniref:hypothetical protein n=1 Tax=Brevibacillus parabrevis TaxID=54914 RepID=UPI0028D8180C|nr:hypothetical protein [Brevibacillus parabrevis]
MSNLLTMSSDEFRDFLSQKTLPELFVDGPVLRALVQMIPAFGPLVDAFLALPGTKYKEQRLNHLLLLIYQSIRAIDDKVLNLEWANTPEFQDMLEIAIESSVKSRSNEKIIINAMILTNLLAVKNDEGRFRPEEYLRAMADLTPLEVKVIKTFFEVEEKNKERDNNQDSLDPRQVIVEKLGIEGDDLTFILKRVERSGFIKEAVGAMFGYGGGLYSITPSCRKLMEYLSLHPFAKAINLN